VKSYKEIKEELMNLAKKESPKKKTKNDYDKDLERANKTMMEALGITTMASKDSENRHKSPLDTRPRFEMSDYDKELAAQYKNLKQTKVSEPVREPAVKRKKRVGAKSQGVWKKSRDTRSSRQNVTKNSIPVAPV